jgi:hypothetical protein
MTGPFKVCMYPPTENELKDVNVHTLRGPLGVFGGQFNKSTEPTDMEFPRLSLLNRTVLQKFA